MQNALPLALYRMPGEKSIKVLAQKQTEIASAITAKNISTNKGFLFAPFQQNSTLKGILIAPDIFTTSNKLPALNFADKSNAIIPDSSKKVKQKEASKQQYLAYIKKIQRQIKNGTFKKVVAARMVKKRKPENFNPVSFFETLSHKYSSAFVSLVYTPQYGLWIGASPEILLNADKDSFKTYSLAGTKANTAKNKSADWGLKERGEQKIVSDYINTAFKNVAGKKPIIEGPLTIAAGNLLHLRTTFTYPGISLNKWPLVAASLHPTPAVAGLPKKESVSFIEKHETAPRGFYSGYLGPVNMDKQVSLFVNLRCMQVLKSKLAVHVGCGITAMSNPKDEWKESQMKAETLLSVLKAGK